MTTETIDARTIRSRDNVDFVEILKAGEHKLRVQIRSNPYDFQCYAYIEKWDGDKWNQIAFLGDENMGTPPKLYYRTGVTAKEFQDDRDELVKLALAVLA